MPGLVVTAILDARQLETRFEALKERMVAGQKTMASAAEESSARVIQSIEEQIAAETEGTEAYKLLMRERAVAMENYSAIVERETQLQISREAAANAAATKAAEKREQLQIRGQLRSQAAARAEEKALELAREKALAEAEATKNTAIKAEAAAAAAADAEAIKRETLALRGEAAAAAAARAEEKALAVARAESAGVQAGKTATSGINLAPQNKEEADAAYAAAKAANAKAVAEKAEIEVLAISNVLSKEDAEISIAEAEAKVLVTKETLAQARANMLLAVSSQTANTATVNWKGSLTSLISIFKDIARGQWNRAISASATLIQNLASAGGAANGAMAILATTLGVVASILVGLGLGAYVAYKGMKAVSETLMGFQLPDFHPEYIAKHLQGVNAIAEEWKKINEEMDEVQAKYDSVAASAERLSKVTKDKYEHDKKMAEYAEQGELAAEKDPEKRNAIREKYAKEQLARDKQQRQTEFDQQQVEAINLKGEAKKNMDAASAIGVIPSKERDEENVRHAKANAEAAQKFLDDYSKKGQGFLGNAEDHSDFTDKVVRKYNAVTDSGVSGADLTKATDDAVAKAKQTIQDQKKIVEEAAANEESRRKREILEKRAEAAAEKAAGLDASEADREAAIDAANAYEAAETAAAIKAGNEKADAAEKAETKFERKAGILTSNQQVGAYISPGTVSIIEVTKGIHAEVKGLRKDVQKNHSEGGGHF